MALSEPVGWLGMIVVGLAGLGGGVVGTWFGITNTSGPRERKFMVKVSIVGWIAILVFLGLLFALPRPYRWLMWVPYGILLPTGIIHTNKKLQAIRKKESTD